MIKSSYLVDVPVLLIFFARPECLEKVFKQVRLAKPSKLYLYQDGPRENRPDDIENIEKCRKIVSDIDWECAVHYNYKEINVGCDPSEYIAQKWMFETEKYGIILEDDDVPSVSFFSYCKDLLLKYENDVRIQMICGMNHLGTYNDENYDYFFALTGSIWGWATWKRIIDNWDPYYEFLSDTDAIQRIKKSFNSRKDFNDFMSACYKHKKSGKAHYETINGADMRLHNRLAIIPTRNMISNVGVGNNTTHSTDNIKKLPKSIQNILFMKTSDITLPLRYQQYIYRNYHYEKRVDNILGHGYISSVLLKIESFVRKTIYS